jgi:V8-like Glu-specific endopeptidase
VFGVDKFQTLQWYRRGLECCGAIARVETPTGRGLGTGWLLAGRDWPAAFPEPLLVTNAHVVSPPTRPYPGAVLPSDAVANFQVAGTRSRLGDVVWSSPVDELDCTIVRLEALPPAQPLELSKQPVTYKAASRLYIIGHPGGHDLKFSLQDNLLVGCDARLLHYRTPTEGGSSGSPVFDDEWRVVGLHHAGDAYLARLDGQPGTYEANEGIAIAALLHAAAAAASV